MAIIQVSKICIFCKKELTPGEKCVTILPCSTTAVARRGQWWDTEKAPTPIEDGMLRINFRNAKKERGILHLACHRFIFENYDRLFDILRKGE